MTKFINRLNNNTLAYNQLIGKDVGLVFLSGFNSDMQGKKALYLEKWAKENNHSFLRFDYSGHGQSSGTIETTCFNDWYEDAEFIINNKTKDKANGIVPKKIYGRYLPLFEDVLSAK